MTYSLSASTRFLIAVLLVLALAFQIIFSSVHQMGQLYAHNGRIAVDQKLWREAVYYYDRAIDWFPYNHHWWFAKGQGHQGQFDSENTALAFNQARTLAPYHVASIASLAYEIRDAGDPAEIQTLLDSGFTIAPHYWNLFYTEGLLHMRTGDREGAHVPLSLAERNSTDIIALVERSVAYNALATGDIERAAYSIEKAVNRDASMPELWQLRGQILHSMDDPKAALGSYTRAIALYSDRIKAQPETAQGDSRLRGETQAYLAFAYGALENDQLARENFAAATSEFVDLAFFGSSIDEIETRLEESAVTPDPRWANVLSAAGRHDAALADFTALETSTPEALSDLERYYFANSLRATGRPADALTQFRKMSSMTWVVAMAYSETLVEAGQPAAARFEYNRILTMLRLNPQQRQMVEARIAALGQ